jgi:DNA-binding beta-propeller fold protein YncE
VLPANFRLLASAASDAAGDVYAVDAGNNSVLETPHGCASGSCQLRLPFANLHNPWGIAIGPGGGVYVTNFNNTVSVLPAGCSSSSCEQVLPFTGLNIPYGVAVDRVGDVYVADTQNQRVVELPVAKLPTKLTATPAVLAGLNLYLFNLTATLTGPSGPISGQTISFSAGSTAVCSAVTGANGTASCSGLAQALSILGAGGYTATFAGSDGYLGSTAMAGLFG